MLQHGLSDCSVSWALNLPSESLVYILADNGYDVWLGNNRGDGYSMSNINYNISDWQFWQFTWDDMALSDLPTQIDFILKETGASQLSYMGVSEGTTQAFAGFLNATVAAKVNLFIALAPVAYVHNQKSLLLTYMADLDAAEILSILGDHEFYFVDAIKKLLPDVCYVDPYGCEYALSFLMGPSVELNSSRLPYYLDYEPNPTSVMNMIHWSQGVAAEVFQMYDYGTQGNIQHYKQPTPPQYVLANLPTTLPIALFTGGNDYLADPTDVATLIQDLPVPPVLHHYEPTYSHVDYVIAENAHIVAYPDILSLLAKYNSQ